MKIRQILYWQVIELINLFSGLRKATDETIAMQIALFESITVTNLTKPYAQRTGATVVKAVKWFADKFDRKINVAEPEIKEIKDLINENYQRLQRLSRAELERCLRTKVGERLHGDAGNTISDENLSVAIINEAAKNFEHIGQNLTSAQKADTIAIEFHNRLRDNLNKQLKNQNASQIAELEQRLDEEISRLNADERRGLQSTLRVQDLTGKTIRNTLIRAGLPALVLGTTSGLGIFVATTTIMHAVFTTMLGITLPFAAYTGAMSFLGVLTGPLGWGLIAGTAVYQIVSGNNKIDREMLAQFIYLARMMNGREFAPLEKELAAWKSVSASIKIADDNIRNHVEDMKRNNFSTVSEEELKAQISELKDEMCRQNDLIRKAVEEEFIQKQKEIEFYATEKEESLRRIIQERDEIIERQKIADERRFDELRKKYEQTVKEQNEEIRKLRKSAGETIERMERNKRNKMLRNEEIRNRLIETINNARYEIDIMSPWMNRYVVDDDFISKLQRAIKRGVTVKIRYGIGGKYFNEKDRARNERTESVASILRSRLRSDKLKLIQGNEHSKLFICDDDYYVLTSFNPLSFGGDYSKADQRGEIGELSHDKSNLNTYRKLFFDV